MRLEADATHKPLRTTVRGTLPVEAARSIAWGHDGHKQGCWHVLGCAPLCNEIRGGHNTSLSPEGLHQLQSARMGFLLYVRVDNALGLAETSPEALRFLTDVGRVLAAAFQVPGAQQPPITLHNVTNQPAGIYIRSVAAASFPPPNSAISVPDESDTGSDDELLSDSPVEPAAQSPSSDNNTAGLDAVSIRFDMVRGHGMHVMVAPITMSANWPYMRCDRHLKICRLWWFGLAQAADLDAVYWHLKAVGF